jgi:hypothetical protein
MRIKKFSPTSLALGLALLTLLAAGGCLLGVAEGGDGTGSGDQPPLDGFDAPSRLSPRIQDDVMPNLVYLSWTNVADADHYEVYVGPDTNPPLVATVTVNNHVMRDLPECTEHYWRVVAVRGDSRISSAVWIFKTRCDD